MLYTPESGGSELYTYTTVLDEREKREGKHVETLTRGLVLLILFFFSSFFFLYSFFF